MIFSFTPFPVLHTPRLVLRQATPGDAKDIFLIRSNEQVLQYLDMPKCSAIHDAQEHILKVNRNISANESIYWVITLKDTGALIGTICLWNLSETEQHGEAGYMLLPAHHGKGLMHEALSAVIDFGFSEMKLQCIEAYTLAENERSVKLLEKCGFRKTSPGTGEVKEAIFTLLKQPAQAKPDR